MSSKPIRRVNSSCPRQTPEGPPDLRGDRVACARILQHLRHAHAERVFVDAGSLAVTGDRQQLGARRPRRASAAEPVRAAQQDQCRSTVALHVVHDRGPPEIALLGQPWRPVARDAALALERLDERGRLAAHVRARADVDLDVEVEALTAADRLAEQSGLPAPLERLAQRLEHVAVLAAQVHEPLRRTDAVGGNGHALEDEVGVLAQQQPVLERARLALVRVADHDTRRDLLTAAALPLHAGGEAGAATSQQARTLDLFERGLRPGAVRLAALDGRADRLARSDCIGEHGVAAPHEIFNDEQLARPFGQRNPREDQVAQFGRAAGVDVRHRKPVHEQRRRVVAEPDRRGPAQAHEPVLGDLAGFDPEALAHLAQPDRGAMHAVGDVVREQQPVRALRLRIEK